MIESAPDIKVFYLYASEDESLQNLLEKQLSILRRQRLITEWHKRKIIAGMEVLSEIDVHLNEADLILLLVSSDFMASEYCENQVKRALARYKAGEAHVVPVLLRPTDYEDAPFAKLQFLPTNGEPVTKWNDRDEAFLDIVKGIRNLIGAVSSLKGSKQREIEIQYSQYCTKIHEKWKMLDFKGIMHLEMKRPISIPLAEVFIYPDVSPLPKYEILKPEEGFEDEEDVSDSSPYEKDAHLNRMWQRKRQVIPQRESLQSVLIRNSRLVILGHPGSGKSTLLHYFMLMLAAREETTIRIFSFTSGALTIPLYIKLSSYADFLRSSPIGERAIKHFLPRYLNENYLEKYVNLLQDLLERECALILFDGLDEIPDTSVRIQVVRRIEEFTQAYPNNRFIVTSRIVGYEEAALAVDYQPYCLADFNEPQIKTFMQKWCLAYEHWVRKTEYSPSIYNVAAREADKLFAATQSNPGVKRLTSNPLMLTILALIQYQGKDLPKHRVELFELCIGTLLETWVKAREYTREHSTQLSKRELENILRPLAFWMHSHHEVGLISKEDLTQHFVIQMKEHRISEDEAIKRAEQFLQIIRGETGVLVEQGKNRYGFLHQAFEEYFAASQLKLREDKDNFIVQHLHDPRWREVILLTVGIVGIIKGDEGKEVTRLVQQTILNADSPYENWLHRDLLFAGLCLTDDRGINEPLKNEIIQRIVYLYLTSPYNSLREAFSDVLGAWAGTQIAVKLILSVLQRYLITTNIPPSFTARKTSSDFQEKLSRYHQRLIEQYIHRQTGLLHLLVDVALETDPSQWNYDVREITSDADVSVREAAVKALGLIGTDRRAIVTIVLPTLKDPAVNVREAAVKTLTQIALNEERVVLALLQALKDTAESVREGAALALGQGEGGGKKVISALLLTTGDSNGNVRKAAVEALGQIGVGEEEIIVPILLQALSDRNVKVRLAAVEALGQRGVGRESVVAALLKVLRTDWGMKEGTILALAQIQAMKKEVTLALLEMLGRPESHIRQAAVSALVSIGIEKERILTMLANPDWKVKQAAIKILGLIEVEKHELLSILLDALKDKNWRVKQAAVSELGRLKIVGERKISGSLLHVLRDTSGNVRQAAALALGQIEDGKGELVVAALLRMVSDSDWIAREGAALALGHIEIAEQSVATALLKALGDNVVSVREAAAASLGKVGAGKKEVLVTLLQVLKKDIDERVRQRAIIALGQIGGEEEVVPALLQALEDVSIRVKGVAINACGQIATENVEVAFALLKKTHDVNEGIRIAAITALGKSRVKNEEIVSMLLEMLEEDNGRLRYAAATALKKLKIEGEEVISVLLKALSDTSKSLKQEVALFALRQMKTRTPPAGESVVHILRNTSSIEYLQKSVENYNRDICKTFVLRALGLIAQLRTDDDEVATILLQAVKDTDLEIKEQAVIALGQIQSGRAEIVSAILAALRDEDMRVREVAAAAVKEVEVEKESVVEALIISLEDKAGRVRERAAMVLGQIGVGESKVILALLKRLRNDKVRARERAGAITALGQVGAGEEGILPVLLRELRDTNEDVREAAARVLRQVTIGEKVVPALLQELIGPDVEIREAAARALEQVGHGQPHVVTALLQRLNDVNEDKYVKKAIVAALGKIGVGEYQVVSVLLEKLEDDDKEVREAEVRALGLISDGRVEVVAALVNKLEDENEDVREAAARSLGLVGNGEKEVVEALLGKLDDPFWSVKKAVVVALGQMQNEQIEVVDALLQMLNNSSEGIRQAAANALAQRDKAQPDVIDALLKALTDSYASVAYAAIEALKALRVDSNVAGQFIERMLVKHGGADDDLPQAYYIVENLFFALQQLAIN